MQPWPFTYISSATTFVLQGQNLVAVKETIWLWKSKILSIRFFRENVCQLMSGILNFFFVLVRLFQLANTQPVILLIKSGTSPDSSSFSYCPMSLLPLAENILKKLARFPVVSTFSCPFFLEIHWRACFNHFIKATLIRS